MELIPEDPFAAAGRYVGKLERAIYGMRDCRLRRGQLNIRQWKETASEAMGHVWFTDCESLSAHLVSPNTKQVDNKRLAIDLSALLQLIWDNRDDCDEEVDGSKGDHLRWIDASAMLSDC